MEKVLIVSYFFPPCNLTASQRVASWAKYLNEYGYFPIVITRRWDYNINVQQDMSKQTPPDVKHEIYPEYEVFYLPYKPNLKDRIFSKHGENKYVFLRKILSLSELVLQNICVNMIPYKNLYFFSLKYLRQNKDIKKAIVSGNPYIQYKILYKLHKMTKIKWIADYRDAWTSSKINYIERSLLFNYLNEYDRYFEKKWVGTASYITSVSETLAKHISSQAKVQGVSLPNGFIKEEFDDLRNEKPYDKFTITYVGTLFPGQKIDIFLNAFKKFIDANSHPEAKLLLPGLAFKRPQKEIVDELMKGYEKYYECTERIERDDILKIEVKSHLLLYVAWHGFSGIVPSKIYEYIASGSYIVLSPTDNDAVEDIVLKSGCGAVCNNIEETYQVINNVYNKYLQGIKITNDVNTDRVMQFSRKIQVQKLSVLLKQLND